MAKSLHRILPIQQRVFADLGDRAFGIQSFRQCPDPLKDHLRLGQVRRDVVLVLDLREQETGHEPE